MNQTLVGHEGSSSLAGVLSIAHLSHEEETV